VSIEKSQCWQAPHDAVERPVSQAEMTVLLDASSLIDLQRRIPLSFADLDSIFRKGRARLVLTRTSVLEFSAPAAETGDFPSLQRELRQIERLPVAYLREGGITNSELKEAVEALAEGREFIRPDPYVERWDETVVVEGPSPARMLVNQRLDDLIFMLWRQRALSPVHRRWGTILRQQFKQDRDLPARVRKAAGKNFRQALRRHLAMFSISYPEEKVGELADWIYEMPTRCPGHRLAYDVRQELMNNLTEDVTENDILDIAHVEAVPYVDAITMDRNTAALCRSVAKRLEKKHPGLRYAKRIFTSLEALLKANF